MNESVISNSFNSSCKLLKKLDLIEEINYSRPFTLLSSKFSEKFIHVSQRDDYLKTYSTAMENRDYDILLKDDSFLQFSCDLSSDFSNWSIRYAYYESPRDVLTYSEFLEDIGLDGEEDEEFVLYEEYEQYKTEIQIKKNVTPLRYDFHGGEYKELVHPISHIHIGFNNNVRIPLNKIMLPLDFVIFIMQHVYIKRWKDKIDESKKYDEAQELIELILRAKTTSKEVDSNYFTTRESKLYYLT